MADLASKQAAVKSGQANVDRLEALASYKMVMAPFDGFVTARDTDVGALINAGVHHRTAAVRDLGHDASCASTSTFPNPTCR